MDGLIERLEKATGPDRLLDVMIRNYVEGIENWEGMDLDVKAAEEFQAESGDTLRIPAYTASLDAAMTLVPEGYAVALNHWPKHPAAAEIQVTALDTWVDGTMQYVGQNIRHNGSAATPAVALCIAALKARAS